MTKGRGNYDSNSLPEERGRVSLTLSRPKHLFSVEIIVSESRSDGTFEVVVHPTGFLDLVRGLRTKRIATTSLETIFGETVLPLLQDMFRLANVSYDNLPMLPDKSRTESFNNKGVRIQDG